MNVTMNYHCNVYLKVNFGFNLVRDEITPVKKY